MPTLPHRRRWPFGLAAAVLSVAVCGCTTISRPAEAAQPGTRTHSFEPPGGPPLGVTSLPSFTAVAEPTISPGTLLAALVPAPPGAQPWNDAAGSGTGPLTLDQVVQVLYGTATEADRQRAEQVETARGFAFAVRRNWVAPDGTKADVFLFQYASIMGAASFFNDHAQTDGADAGPARTFDIPGAGNAVGFSSAGLNAGGDGSVEVIGQRGTVAILILYFSPAHPDPTAAGALAQQQYARLPDLVGAAGTS